MQSKSIPVISHATVGIAFLAMGVAVGFFMFSEPGKVKMSTIRDVDDVLERDDGYGLLEEHFVYADPPDNPEIARYALGKLYEGGGGGYEFSLAHNSLHWHDNECRDLFLAILKQELDAAVFSLVSLAKSLHHESDQRRYDVRVGLIIDYLGLDQAEYEKTLEQSGKEQAQDWLIDHSVAIEDWLKNEEIEQNQEQ